MASVYPRGKKLWTRYKNEEGVWRGAATPFLIGDEEKARRFGAQLERAARITREAASAAGLKPGERLTVAAYARRWVKDRQDLGVRSASDDWTRIGHAVPAIGDLALDDVRPRHIRDVVLALRKKAELAPRTIRHVYATLATMFRTAVADELIIATPCVLPKGVLPKKVDKDPAWRDGAIFTRSEVEQLISDVRVPADRRVLYALKGLAALRHSEASRLRWRHYDSTMEPLGSISLDRTKSGVPRRIPVHATLARVLAEWKLGGWERTFGRDPGADDFIVPTSNLTERQSPESQHALLGDLKRLGLRRRRGHDLRRTFITLAQVDGARRDLLETITHGPRGDIINVYTTFPWPALCEEVAKLKIELREGTLLDGDFETACYSLATRARNTRNRWTKLATPAGSRAMCTPRSL
jgi:integrase